MNEKDKNIANYIIYNCLERGYEINTAKLVYLIILAEGYSLALNNSKLIHDEIYAPNVGRLTIPSIDTHFRKFIAGFKNKDEYLTEWTFNDEELTIINNVINQFGKLNLTSLIQHNTLEELLNKYKKNNEYTLIPTKVISEKFKKKLNLTSTEENPSFKKRLTRFFK